MLRRDGGDPGHNRADPVPVGHRPALQTAGPLHLVAPLPGRRARALPLEQRVHNPAHRGEQRDHTAHPLPLLDAHLQRALEPEHHLARLQRAQAVRRDEPEALRRAHAELQARAGKVLRSFFRLSLSSPFTLHSHSYFYIFYLNFIN